jgi:hypothetical protein
MRFAALMLAHVALWALTGCASLSDGGPRPVPGAHFLPDGRARQLVEKLSRVNAAIETFKGTGKLVVTGRGQRRGTRIMWAGMAPDKLRVEILGLPGQPAASIALNDGWLYFDPHSPDRFYRHKLGNDSLKPVLSIAIKAGDLIELFGGRLPIRAHTSARIYQLPPSTGYVLQLEKRWWGLQQKIYLDETFTKVRRIEIFDLTGEFVYRAVFDRIENVDGYDVPHSLTLSNDGGDRVELEIVRYLTNIPVDPAVFVLTPRS